MSRGIECRGTDRHEASANSESHDFSDRFSDSFVGDDAGSPRVFNSEVLGPMGAQRSGNLVQDKLEFTHVDQEVIALAAPRVLAGQVYPAVAATIANIACDSGIVRGLVEDKIVRAVQEPVRMLLGPYLGTIRVTLAKRVRVSRIVPDESAAFRGPADPCADAEAQLVDAIFVFDDDIDSVRANRSGNLLSEFLMILAICLAICGSGKVCDELILLISTNRDRFDAWR
jgi:hypothetical protein